MKTFYPDIARLMSHSRASRDGGARSFCSYSEARRRWMVSLSRSNSWLDRYEHSSSASQMRFRSLRLHFKEGM